MSEPLADAIDRFLNADICATCKADVDSMNPDAITRFTVVGDELTWCGPECAARWLEYLNLPAAVRGTTSEEQG